VVGEGGTIGRTTDGGATWIFQRLFDADLLGVSFTDVSTGTVVGDYGAILRITTGVEVPVPVQLVSFTATIVNQNEVQLDWSTLTEINNYGFEVQKSATRPNNYESIPNRFVPVHGKSEDEIHESAQLLFHELPNQRDGIKKPIT